MTSDQLKYFIITAKHLNFSMAAKELYMTQPAISHQIAALEKELGVVLLHRSTRKISLTRAGKIFLEDAKRMLDMEENAKKRLALADSPEQEILRIAYLLAPCQSFLPRMLNDFQKANPQITLQLTRMDAHGITNAMQVPEADYDLYFSVSRDFLGESNFAYKEIFADTYCVIVSEDHPCAKASTVDFDKLASERFLMVDDQVAPYMNKQIRSLCKSRNFEAKSKEYRSSMEEILFEVESGLGVTILPLKNKFLSPTSLVYLPIQGDDAIITMGMAWRCDEKNTSVEWFLENLQSYMQPMVDKIINEME